MSQMTIKLSKQLSARIAKLSQKRGVSRSEVVRQAIEAIPMVSGESGSIVERFSHLLGIAEKLPRDLSTSKRHFKGFGK